MKATELQRAKNPDLIASVTAIKQLARQTAIQTNTAIVVIKDGVLCRITAEELKQQALTWARKVFKWMSSNMMTMEDWLKRIRLGEDSTLEFKRVIMRSPSKVEAPHPDSLADELAAMANANGGTLILGVDDSKAVIGIAYDALDAVEKWLAELCQNKINPPLDIMTQHIELPDSTGQLQPVIIVQVLRSLMVHKSPNGY